MATAGSIVVDLLLRTGSFETDAQRAAKSVRSFKSAIDDLARASTVLLGVAGTAAGAFLALERGAAAIGKFKDAGDIIGDTAESVASLQTAADVAGTSIDSIASASVKLTSALSKTDDEASGAGAALKALNLPLEEFKRLSPVSQLEAVASAMDSLGGESEKTAIAVALFGKAGAQLIPFLKELSDQGGRRVIITQEQIDAADKFADTTAKLRSQITQLGQSVLADVLPPFQAFVDEIGEADRALSIFSVAGNAARIFFETIAVLGANVIFVFSGVGREIGAIAAQLAALARGDLAGFRAISDAVKEDAARARAELDRFEQRVLGATQAAAELSKQRRVEDRGFDPRPRPDISGLAEGSDASKKLVDNQIKALESVIRREQDLLQERNRFLNLFNDQGLLSISAYYDAQLTIIQAATSAQVAAIDKQIALTTAARNAATKATDRADQQGKLNELVEKRARVEQEAGAKAIELSIRRADAERKFGDQVRAVAADVAALEGRLADAAAIRFDQQNFELVRRLTAEGNTEGLKLVDTLRKAAVAQAEFAQAEPVRQLNASVLELQGNLGAAAAIRFDSQNFELIQRFIAQGNAAGLQLVATLRAATIAQAEFSKASADGQRVTDQLANAEDRIAISRQLGATTELGALKQLGDARQAAIVQLEAMVRAQEAIARASGNPALVQNAERARIELERLRAVADPLGDKFRSIFEEAGATGIETFLNDVSKGKDAITAFGDEVTRQINRIIAQNASEAIFGKDGLLGGLVGSFAGLFGGTSSAGGDAVGASARAAADTSAAAATTAMAAAATTATASLTALPATAASSLGTLAAAAELAASALQKIATTEATEGAATFVGGFFASGGIPPVGVASVVGENGPELFVPNTAGRILPADATERVLRGSNQRPINVNFQLPPGPVTKQTEQQIAVAAGRGVQRALARDA